MTCYINRCSYSDRQMNRRTVRSLPCLRSTSWHALNASRIHWPVRSVRIQSRLSSGRRDMLRRGRSHVWLSNLTLHWYSSLSTLSISLITNPIIRVHILISYTLCTYLIYFLFKIFTLFINKTTKLHFSTSFIPKLLRISNPNFFNIYLRFRLNGDLPYNIPVCRPTTSDDS